MRERVFILCGGNSLRDEKLGWLNAEDVIAVNYAVKYIEEPTYFLTADSGVIQKSVDNNFWHLTEKTKKIAVMDRSHKRYDKVKDCFDKFDEHIEQTTSEGFLYDQNEEGFGTGKNTGFAALQFSIKKGYKKIYLLGIDLGKLNGKKYFYDNNEGSSPYDIFYQHFVNGLKMVKDKVEIFSCSPVSRLNKHIPFVSLSSLVPKMPVFVSHYTIDTPYQDIIKKLEASLIKFNLDYDFTGIKHLGSWRANSNYCAWQVRDMLKKYMPRSILRLDADAIVEKYPELLRGMKCDVAACIYKNSRLRHNEFLGGTLYFGNTAASHILADEWVNACQKDPRNRNGDLLEALIKKMKVVKFSNLPMSYCRIFDFENMGKEKVIVHYQASRKNKRLINYLKIK